MTRNGNSINRRPQAIYPLRNLYDTRLGRAEVAGDEVETPHTERLASAVRSLRLVQAEHIYTNNKRAKVAINPVQSRYLSS